MSNKNIKKRITHPMLILFLYRVPLGSIKALMIKKKPFFASCKLHRPDCLWSVMTASNAYSYGFVIYRKIRPLVSASSIQYTISFNFIHSSLPQVLTSPYTVRLFRCIIVDMQPDDFAHRESGYLFNRSRSNLNVPSLSSEYCQLIIIL